METHTQASIEESSLQEQLRAHYAAEQAKHIQPGEFSVNTYAEANKEHGVTAKEAYRALEASVESGTMTKRMGISGGRNCILYRFKKDV